MDVNVFRVNSLNGTEIVAEGDSGGPVVQFAGSGAYGLATITSGINSIRCDGNTDPSAGLCYTGAYLTPINQVADALALKGIFLETT